MNSYYEMYDDYFWEWQEEGEVLCLTKGYTLAYRSHLIEILETLQPEGLPSFSALVSVLAALSSNSEEAIQFMESFNLKEDATTEKWDTSIWKVLQAVPEEYRKGKKKLILLYTLFEKSHNRVSPSRSKSIINKLRSQPASKSLETKGRNSSFRLLEILSKKFPTVGSLLDQSLLVENLFVDKLNDSLKEEDTCEDTSNTPKNLIDELLANPYTFHVGALIRRIQAGLKITYRTTHSGIQALGGYSDITNKGDISRILVSEFAYEDTIFLSRWSNNETMYMNREVPPDNTRKERIILIDVSMYNWGTPKLLAYSVMLAIATHPKSEYITSAFAIGNNCIPLSISTPLQIADSLLQVDAGLHAANGLEQFFKENRPINKEILLVTGNKAESHPEMQKVFSKYYSALSYRIYTNAQGEISSYKVTKNGKLHIQDIRLDLENLWKNRVAPSDTDPKEEQRDLLKPMIPINFQIGVSDVYRTSMGNFFGVLKGRLFMKVDKDSKGWLLIDEKVFGKLVAVGVSKTDGYICFTHLTGKRHSIKNVQTQRTIEFELPGRINPNQDVFFKNNRFFMHLTWGNWLAINIRGDQELINESDLPKRSFKNPTQMPSILNSYLSRIKAIGISNGKLVINSHYLCSSSLLWRHDSSLSSEKYAFRQEGSRVFKFSEGTIVTNYEGLISIQSSKPELPTVYIPTTISRPLGIATDNEFAGDTVFYPDTLVEMAFEETPLSNEVKAEIYTSGITIDDFDKEIWHLSANKAGQIRYIFNSPSFAVMGKELNIIPNEDFYTRYIQPIIDNIERNI